MHANVVIALGSEETLPGILARIHGSGLGHNAYVHKPRRSTIQHQLMRSGIPTAQMPPRVDDAEAALVIHAAARAGLAADITRLHGASATWIVSPSGAWTLLDDDIAVNQGDVAEPAVSIDHDSPLAPAQVIPEHVASDETPGI